MDDGDLIDDDHQRYEAIIEKISHIVYIKSPNGRYELMNSAGEDLFGMSQEEIIGKRDDELFGPEAAEEIRAIDSRVMAEGEPTVYESRRGVDGEERVFQNEKYPYTPQDDAIEGIIGISKDVTEEMRRQEALEELHEASQRLMVATSTGEVASIATETMTEVLDLPTNGLYLYDRHEEALVPEIWTDPHELLGGEEPPVIRAGEGLAWKAFESGEALSFDDVRSAEIILNPDTEFRSELFFPLGDHGLLMIGSMEVADFDATDEALGRIFASNVEAALDRLEHEQELQRQNERLSEFASVVSHDIRNPLNVADTRLELIREEHESSHLDRLSAAHERIDAIVEDVLTWARQGQTVEELEVVALNSIARRCWAGVGTDAATLIVEDEPTIRADPVRLQRILENLFRNAIEHGGPEVSVSIGSLESGRGFYVADSGPGIPDGARERVFETGYSTASEGTGFGLAIIQQIADAHGWSVSSKESETGGARFEFAGVEVLDR